MTHETNTGINLQIVMFMNYIIYSLPNFVLRLATKRITLSVLTNISPSTSRRFW